MKGKHYWFVMAAVLVLNAPGFSQERAAHALIIGVNGTAQTASKDKEQEPSALQTGMALTAGQTITNGEDAVVDMVLTTKAVARLSNQGKMRVETLKEESKGLPGKGTETVTRTVLYFERGSLMVSVGKLTGNSMFAVQTPIGMIRVMGTEFGLWTEGNQMNLRVIEGEVVIITKTGTYTVKKGQQISFSIDSGQVTSTSGSGSTDDGPVISPVNDSFAKLFQDFKTNLNTVINTVMTSPTVQVNLLLPNGATVVSSPTPEVSPSRPQ